MWDVVVVGAGPAGAAAAITARQKGLSTVVLEAERFPRHHVGESLVRLWTVFETLGVLDRMDATFQHKSGSGRIWGERPTPHWSAFDDNDLRPYSLQVRRSQFDAILAERAATLGADLRFGWRAADPLYDGRRVVGVRALDPAGVAHDLRARFLIDASGRTGFMARRRKLRVAHAFYPDLSVFAYLTGARRFEASRAGSLFIESVPWGWFWFIPLKDGEVSVGLVCDRDTRPQLKRMGLSAFFHAAVGSSEVISDLLREASIARPAMAVASSGYSSSGYSGEGWFVAGDAGQFVDPMWATGVGNSMRDGIRAASAAHGVISAAVTEEDAVEFHDRESVEQAEALHDIVRYVYGLNVLHRDAPFWRRRHDQLDVRPEALRERSLAWLAKDPASYYFREAFSGMGVASSAVAQLDTRVDDLATRSEQARVLASGPLDRWVPAWAPGWAPRHGVGLDLSGVVRAGVEIGRGYERLFSANPATIAALRAIDGRRSVATILRSLAVDGLERLRVLASLRLAHSEGAIEDRGVVV